MTPSHSCHRNSTTIQKPRGPMVLRGRLSNLLDMPRDIIYEIFGHLDPLDLLRLTRTCKNPLRDNLMERRSISIWKAARFNVGLPPPPHDMSEPAFADLVFIGCCHSCGCMTRLNENIFWMIPTRLCAGCRLQLFKSPRILLGSTPDVTEEELKLAECIPSDSCGFYMESMFESHLDEYRGMQGDKERLEAWFDRKIALMKARRKHAKLCDEWVKDREKERIDKRKNVRQRRQKAILQKLSELGWQEEIDKLTMRSDFYSHPLVRSPRELTDRIWTKIQDPMIALMEQSQAVRMHQVHRSRYEVLRKMYPVYCDQQDSSLVLPNLSDIININSVKQLAENPSKLTSANGGSESTTNVIDTSIASSEEDNIFGFLSDALPFISQSCYNDKCADLVSIARQEIPEFEMSDLFLATTVFKCTASRCHSRLNPSSAFTHPCTSSCSFRPGPLRELKRDQEWFGSSPWNYGGHRLVFDLEASKKMGEWIEALKVDLKAKLEMGMECDGLEERVLDPASRDLTEDDLNQLCVVMECSSCSSYGRRMMMFWIHALNHIFDNHYQNGSASADDVKVYTLFDIEENAAFLAAEHGMVMKCSASTPRHPPKKKIFACSHCNHSSPAGQDPQSKLKRQCRFSKKELIEHLRTVHGKTSASLQRSDWEWTANVSSADIPNHAFAKEGYSIALIARRAEDLKEFEAELKATGAEAASFPIPSYGHKDIQSAFTQIRSRFPPNAYSLRAALYNAGNGVWKPFLEVTPEDVQIVTQSNIEGSFAFSHEVIKEFKDNSVDPVTGKRGILIFTGATASIRGNVTTSAFAAGKFALRALSQSLSKEFGKQNIHIAHAIIDGSIITPQGKERYGDKWDPSPDGKLKPESIAASYIYLAKQDRSSWTWELDLRPAHEKW
ncbi:hypothetical protein D9758_004380 [Tetrapyrgos nigripes]|uniref:F-box domain-containing protein n=1 Tax=Tetrapyrgos nigripes TaxID=182062 RepID=A0A8H5GNW6_9AGAR|nr:hypothetical protein D9758_004380 [Tetrapyrgos nigripes]